MIHCSPKPGRKRRILVSFTAEEFVGIIFRDDEDGELSYNFSMAILEMDLE